jgi:hypothetical protein
VWWLGCVLCCGVCVVFVSPPITQGDSFAQAPQLTQSLRHPPTPLSDPSPPPTPPSHPHPSNTVNTPPPQQHPVTTTTQVGLHEQYGGVKPDVAQAAHAAAIEATVDGAIADAGITPQQLSAVAVTIGPGLSLCLQVCAGDRLVVL